MARALKVAIYFGSSIAIAWYGWASWSEALPQYKNEALMIPTILLYALTLPISLVVQLLYTAMAAITPLDRIEFGSMFNTWLIKTWLMLVVAGYVQWFVLFPRLMRKWRLRGHGAGEAT